MPAVSSGSIRRTCRYASRRLDDVIVRARLKDATSTCSAACMPPTRSSRLRWIDYNHHWPHTSLRGLTPNEFATQSTKGHTENRVQLSTRAERAQRQWRLMRMPTRARKTSTTSFRSIRDAAHSFGYSATRVHRPPQFAVPQYWSQSMHSSGATVVIGVTLSTGRSFPAPVTEPPASPAPHVILPPAPPHTAAAGARHTRTRSAGRPARAPLRHLGHHRHPRCPDLQRCCSVVFRKLLITTGSLKMLRCVSLVKPRFLPFAL
jgi:hypothetical protein